MKESEKFARKQPKAEAKATKPVFEDKYDLFQHSKATPHTEEKFQHPI